MKTVLKYQAGKLKGWNIKTDGKNYYACKNRRVFTHPITFTQADNWIKSVNEIEVSDTALITALNKREA